MNNIPETNEIDQDNVENIMSIVLSFMGNAVQDAGTYVEHSGRTVVTKKDIQMALQAETFEYIHREDIEGSLLYYKDEVKKDIERHNDVTYEDSDSEEDTVQTFLNNKVVPDSDMEKYTKSLCKCSVCKRLNQAVLTWEHWTPETDMEKIIKKVIDIQLTA
tara:strand:+ start:137 stop:619 length:483 start_codon:yes stop_codon:yes gene_type:complete